MAELDSRQEAVMALLAGREAVYALLARCWQAPLDKSSLEALSSPTWRHVLGMFETEDEPMLFKRLEAVGRAAETYGVEGCASAFNWCFMGLGTRVAPWESVYCGKERMVMQPSTLEVRQSYAEAGFVARNKGAEPDDHVATECDFMAKMASRAQGQIAEGLHGGAGQTLGSSQRFLEDHLSAKAEKFAEAFERECANARDCDAAAAQVALEVYGALARFAVSFYRADRELLAELAALLD